jgi:endonuclease YncB( thermonuclease family)
MAQGNPQHLWKVQGTHGVGSLVSCFNVTGWRVMLHLSPEEAAMRKFVSSSLHAALAVVMCSVAPVPAAHANGVATLIGVPVAKDGDTIMFGRVGVRLAGIVAPEYNAAKVERGGRDAFESLSRLVSGRQVLCELNGDMIRDGQDGTPVPRGRDADIANFSLVATCRYYAGAYSSPGADIAEMQVRAGMALNCPRWSARSMELAARYAQADAYARQAGARLGDFYPLPAFCM